MDVIYSMTEAGYRAWLDDGNQGTFEDFLQDQTRVSNKEWLIEKILAELNRMSLEELKEFLEAIRDRNFMVVSTLVCKLSEVLHWLSLPIFINHLN